MNRASALRSVFRKINEGLLQIQNAPRGEVVRISESLIQINEELCDKIIEIVTNDTTDRTNQAAD